MTIQLHRDEYTNLWVLPGERFKRAGGGNNTSGIVRINILYDAHDATAYRIYKVLQHYASDTVHRYAYGDKYTRVQCRQLLAAWLTNTLQEGPLFLYVSDALNSNWRDPDCYMNWVIQNHAAIMEHINIDKTGKLDSVLPTTFKKPEPPNPIDAIRASIVP